MKSSIKIDFTDNGRGMEPVLKVKFVRSDDPRDGLLQAFFEALQHTSKWLEVRFEHGVQMTAKGEEQVSQMEIYPVRGHEMAVMWRAVFSQMPTCVDHPITAEELIRQLCYFVTNEPVKQEMVDKIKEVLGFDKPTREEAPVLKESN